jgi:hypothetical protein
LIQTTNKAIDQRFPLPGDLFHPLGKHNEKELSRVPRRLIQPEGAAGGRIQPVIQAILPVCPNAIEVVHTAVACPKPLIYSSDKKRDL